MILRPDQGRLRIALQTDHAALASDLARAWGGKLFSAPEPLGPVRLAAELHDAGWHEWELEPRIFPETGRPFDFLSLPPDEHIPLYERGIRMALAEHPYTGLLVSLHGAGLYRRRYGHMPELSFKEHEPQHRAAIDLYLSEQQQVQARLIADLRPDEDSMWTHYRWLQAWDLLSLFICLSEPSERRRLSLGVMPAAPGGTEHKLCVQGVGAGLFCVTPWPFAVPQLELVVPVRYVTDRRYGSDAEFQTAFRAAPTEPLRIRLAACASAE